MHTKYRNPVLRQWRDARLSTVSPAQVLEEADRAERLFPGIQPKRSYRFAEVVRRISGARVPRAVGGIEVMGEDLLSDLRLFIEDVTEAAGMSPQSAGQTILTMQEVARKLNVSTKTISRWRKH